MPTDATRPTDDEVREVLAPFARFMDARQGLREADDGSFASTIIHGGTGDPKNGIPCDQTKLTIGDLRRAKALLDRLTTPQPHIAAEPGEVERKDLLARIDAEVERITGWHPAKDILRDCRRVLTAPEPRTAGEGALADSVRYLLDNEPLAVRVHEGGCAQEDLAASLSITWLKLQKAALRQPSTDRESVRKAIETLANDYQTSDEHHPDHVLIPTSNFLTLCVEAGVVPHSENGIIEQRIAAIRALKASSKGGDHGGKEPSDAE